MRGNGSVTRRTVQELTGLPQSAAAILVRSMVERGMLAREAAAVHAIPAAFRRRVTEFHDCR